nr:Ig-like domain-containing protein [Paenibacillus turpanensis]
MIALGDSTSFALKHDGTVWAWGSNIAGQLGNGTTTESLLPVQVPGLSGIVSIAAGALTGYAVKSDGTVYSWGSGSSGALGNNSSANSNIPVQVMGLTGVIQVSANYYGAVALKGDGTVSTWGIGEYGALGNGTTVQSTIPVSVPNLSGIIAVSKSRIGGFALRTDGTLWGWGYNAQNQLNTDVVDPNAPVSPSNQLTPVQITGLSGITKMSAGDFHTMAIDEQKRVYIWGRNSGLVGDGTSANTYKIETVTNVPDPSLIFAGSNNSFIVTSGNRIYSTGYNATGLLGDGTTSGRTTFASNNSIPIALPDVLNVTEDSFATGTLKGTDADQEPLTYHIVTPASKGTVTITDPAAGTYRYTPNLDATGTDEFSFKTNDGRSNSLPASITVTITPVQDTPIAENGTLHAVEDTAAHGTLPGKDVDGDTLIYSVVDQPGKGTVTITNPATGAYVYQPNLNENGSDSFTFKVNDGISDSNIAHIQVSIQEINDAPAATDTRYSTFVDTSFNGRLAAADVESTSEQLTYTIVQQPQNGIVTLEANGGGMFTYTPNAGFITDSSTTESFQYQVSDSGQLTDTAFARIDVLKSANAKLSDLVVAAEEKTTTLVTSTDTTNQTSFHLQVSNEVASATVTASVYNQYASININHESQAMLAGTAIATIPLSVGDNVIPVQVTAQDGTLMTYEIRISRALSNDARLKLLSVDSVNFMPVFNEEQPSYEANVPNLTAEVTVTAAVYEPNAKLSLNQLEMQNNVGTSVALQEGSNTVSIEVLAQDGVTRKTYVLNVIRAASSDEESSGGGGAAPAYAAPAQPAASQQNQGIAVKVDGKIQEQSATASTSNVAGKKVTKVQVDNDKVIARIEQDSSRSVSIPVQSDSEIVIGELNGQLVKAMERKEAVIEIQTNRAHYTLPASQINIDRISSQMGAKVELKDITIGIRIAQSSQENRDQMKLASQKEKLELVIEPVDFEVQATYNGNTVDVNTFNSYVERAIAIPNGVDPSRITTGVVLNSDGTISHVPTKVVSMDGAYFALISSLTNSTYSVVWNPTSFTDVEQHWSKDSVNNMGSRLIIQGISDQEFAPDQNITRAEFAALVTRAMGLYKTSHQAGVMMTDIHSSEWYYQAVQAALAYGLVNGYEDGTFQPNQTISRVEAMVILNRAMKLSKLEEGMNQQEAVQLLDQFDDHREVGDWAVNATAAVVNQGIAQGYNGNLHPADSVTRAQTAVMLEKLLQKADLINSKNE